MVVFMNDGSVIEHARMAAAGPMDWGLGFAIEGDTVVDDGDRVRFNQWVAEKDIRTIDFYRDHR